jgi:hypothetical protein
MANVRTVVTNQGSIKAVTAPNARQSFVALPTNGQNAGVAAKSASLNVPAVRAGNSRNFR